MGRFGDFPVRVGVKTKDVYESIGLMKVVKETEEGNGFWKTKVILMEPTEAGKAALMEYKTVKGGVGHCFKWANLEVASIDAVQDSKMAEGEKMVTYTAKVSKPAEWVSQPAVMEKLGYNAQELITRVSKRNTYIFFETKNGWEIR